MPELKNDFWPLRLRQQLLYPETGRGWEDALQSLSASLSTYFLMREEWSYKDFKQCCS